MARKNISSVPTSTMTSNDASRRLEATYNLDMLSSRFSATQHFDHLDYSIHPTAFNIADAGDETHPPHTSLSFACPFYKFNPQVYDECKKHRFPRISDIKQHLIRRHSLPPYLCSVCWISFPDEQSKLHHLCRGKGHYKLRPEGLSIEEIRSVRRIRGGSSEDQWFSIWGQLFSGYTMPLSPYIQPNNIKEVVSLLSPFVEAVFHATLPSLSTKDPETSGSFVTRTLTDACQIYFQSLPASRHIFHLSHDSPALYSDCPDPARGGGEGLVNGMSHLRNVLPNSSAYQSNLNSVSNCNLVPAAADAETSLPSDPSYWVSCLTDSHAYHQFSTMSDFHSYDENSQFSGIPFSSNTKGTEI